MVHKSKGGFKRKEEQQCRIQQESPAAGLKGSVRSGRPEAAADGVGDAARGAGPVSGSHLSLDRISLRLSVIHSSTPPEWTVLLKAFNTRNATAPVPLSRCAGPALGSGLGDPHQRRLAGHGSGAQTSPLRGLFLSRPVSS